jgi:hypothetical protein
VKGPITRQLKDNKKKKRRMGNASSSNSHEPLSHQDSIKRAATKAVYKKLQGGGKVSPEEMQKFIGIYETASKAVQLHFPGAARSADILGPVAAVLKRIGCNNENTLFAQSICPDEINHEDDDISRLLQVHLGEVFHMGGLAGIPFTGKTGFAAYTHHIPDDGNLFILFAPHVGISNTGAVGEYSRVGQKNDGKACGAASGGYNHCCAPNATIPSLTDIDPHDYQQQFIIREIHERLDKIKAKKDEKAENNNKEQTELAFQMYDIVKSFLEKIVTLDFHKDNGENINGRLILLGGIQINMPYPMEDYFLPLLFEIRTNQKPTLFIFDETFGVEGKPVPQPLIKQLSDIHTEKTIRLKKIAELENEKSQRKIGIHTYYAHAYL